MRAYVSLEEGFYQEPNVPFLRLPSSSNCAKKKGCYLSHPVCGILIEQPELRLKLSLRCGLTVTINVEVVLKLDNGQSQEEF
jgi:hypothetical protein